MNLSAKRWLVGASAILLSGALATGAAFAASTKDGQSTAAPTARMHRYGSSQGVTKGEADVLAQLHALRKKQMGQLHADAKALIDKAVADGKITRAQADNLWQNRGQMGGRKAGFERLSEADLKARLDEKVKSGQLTQARADQILKHWQEHQTKKGQ